MLKRFAIGLVAAILVLSLVVARRHDLLRFAFQAGAGLAGYALRIADFHIGWDGAEFDGIRVERANEPLLAAARIALRYSLRDLLPGSRHRFGLVGAEVDGAKLTLLRFKDGTFNVALPAGGPARAAPVPRESRSDSLLAARARYADRVARTGRVRLQRKVRAGARDHRRRDVDTAAVTSYRASGAFEERRAEPFTIAGRIDTQAGYAMHRARAAYFPARALANYFADTAAVRILGGEGRNLDARIYALGVEPNVTPQYHVSVQLDVDRGRLAMPALAAPLENLQARLQVIDNAFFVRGATANLAGIPLHIEGGVYDFTGALTGRAQLRLGVWGDGDLSALRQAFSFARDQPIAGKASLGVLVHGPIDDPVIVAKVNAPKASYRALPFGSLAAGVVYHANVVALAPLRVDYSGIALRVDGTMNVGRHLHSEFGIHVEGAASRLPYLDEMLGDEPIVIDAAATGDDLLFHLTGSAASARGVSRVAALVDTNPNGTAAVAPFWFHTERGDFDGGYLLDRPSSRAPSGCLRAACECAHRVTKRSPESRCRRCRRSTAARSRCRLPAAAPERHRSCGHRRRRRRAHRRHSLRPNRGGVRRNAAERGDESAARIGPVGNLRRARRLLVAALRRVRPYRGTFEGLQPLIGNAIAGHGPVAGTVGIGVEPQRIVVQGSNLAMRGRDAARHSGRSREHHAGDRRKSSPHLLGAGARGRRRRRRRGYVRARARGRGEVARVSTGRQAPEGGGAARNRVPARSRHAFGNRQICSRLADADVRRRRRYRSRPHRAFSDHGQRRRARRGRLRRVTAILGALGGTYASVDGSISALSSGSPAYSLDAVVPAAQIAPTLRSFGLPNYMTDGTFNARLRIGGRSLAPPIAGSVGVPGGDVNGLPFIDGSATIAADPRGVAIRDGSVLVGTTASHFTAVSRPHESSIDLRAPRADLSDFNNFFDTGDTLDGNGGVKLAASSHDSRITSSGNIDVRGFRYRNLPIGDTKAVWSSARNVITGTLAVGGREGMLRASGSIGLTPSGAWQSTLMRSRFDLAGGVENLDLSLWLPALGMQSVPVTGRASGVASVHGRFPALDVRASASLAGGTLGPLSLDRADVALHSAGTRIVVDRAEMATSAIAASATGTLGLGVDEPLDLQVHAATAHLAELVYDVARFKVPVRGSFESTLKVGGTFKAPTLVAGFDANDVVAYGVPIASLFGEMRVERHALVLSNAGATFARGQATLAGSLPLGLAPLRLAAPDQPISFDLDVVGLDPSIFDAVFGSNTKLGGIIDGHLGLSGTVRRPAIVGRLSLTNGSYVSDLERVAIQQIAAAIAFNHTSLTIAHASARLGNGTIAGSGSVAFPNGFSRSGASISLRARRAARSSTFLRTEAERSTRRSRSLNGRARTRCFRET